MSIEIRGHNFTALEDSLYLIQPQSDRKTPIIEIHFIDTEVGTKNLLIRVSSVHEIEFLNVTDEEEKRFIHYMGSM
jgi:hypothetical protein